MLLRPNTPVYVTGRDGTSRMSLDGLFNALRGGSRWDELEVTTDPAHSKELERKRACIEQVTKLMSNMTGEQAEKTVSVLMEDEGLMMLHGEYA